MQHYFLNQSIKVGQLISIPTEVKKHWIKVMRASDGTKAEFVDDHERVFIGELVQSSTTASIKVLCEKAFNAELPFSVTIVCGVSKNDKADWIVRKATEMGVDRVIFFASEWSIAKWPLNRVQKKLSRLNTIALSAAEQSHRNRVPLVDYQPKLESIIAADYSQKIVAYEESAKAGEESMLHHCINQMHLGDSLVAVFGPEGGIAPSEIALLESYGFKKAGLGPRILRTETAPLYLLAAISAFSELS
ncbi:16S rRNA (uracil(1498)-N(3))-methyltransferase [Nicoliella spurrieriana]|uniref:Ribosomal RNA small subunit methyltransferase E n=1 Tax=Nicoliella spurrieriana TaxID=2925830 RepID=A0A976RRH7_9LACO|nr:RsmE family RNA methyltransferase [Nicoliella spurrieriana]UQS86523.1 16S rRNA (uracil(1498)-N(3))-methyltransferase [Nicoliella spurrieriana]